MVAKTYGLFHLQLLSAHSPDLAGYDTSALKSAQACVWPLHPFHSCLPDVWCSRRDARTHLYVSMSGPSHAITWGSRELALSFFIITITKAILAGVMRTVLLTVLLIVLLIVLLSWAGGHWGWPPKGGGCSTQHVWHNSLRTYARTTANWFPVQNPWRNQQEHVFKDDS